MDGQRLDDDHRVLIEERAPLRAALHDHRPGTAIAQRPQHLAEPALAGDRLSLVAVGQEQATDAEDAVRVADGRGPVVLTPAGIEHAQPACGADLRQDGCDRGRVEAWQVRRPNDRDRSRIPNPRPVPGEHLGSHFAGTPKVGQESPLAVWTDRGDREGSVAGHHLKRVYPNAIRLERVADARSRPVVTNHGDDLGRQSQACRGASEVRALSTNILRAPGAEHFVPPGRQRRHALDDQVDEQVAHDAQVKATVARRRQLRGPQ